MIQYDEEVPIFLRHCFIGSADAVIWLIRQIITMKIQFILESQAPYNIINYVCLDWV